MGHLNRHEYKDWKPGKRVKPQTHTGEGLTKQEFAKETDINYIMERYRVTGQLPIGAAAHEAVFADVSEMGSFADTLMRVHAAEDAFAALPADLRTRFGNNPVNLVEFLQDDNNREEAVKLGLIAKKEEPQAPTPPAKPEIPAKPDTP